MEALNFGPILKLTLVKVSDAHVHPPISASSDEFVQSLNAAVIEPLRICVVFTFFST